MEKTNFAINLKNALSENRMTQQELANLLHTTQQTVSRWVSGVNEPDFSTFINICVILNETPNNLLGFTET